MAAHAGGVDERQSALQKRAGRTDFGAQYFATAGLWRLTHIGADVVDRDVDGRGFAVRPRRHNEPRPRRVAVADDGDHHGGLVVAHPGHRKIQQGVEQLALALFELAGDHHPDLRIGDPLAGPPQSLRKVGAVVEFGDGDGVVDQLDDHTDPSRVAGLSHRATPLSRSDVFTVGVPSAHLTRAGRRVPARGEERAPGRALARARAACPRTPTGCAAPVRARPEPARAAPERASAEQARARAAPAAAPARASARPAQASATAAAGSPVCPHRHGRRVRGSTAAPRGHRPWPQHRHRPE